MTTYLITYQTWRSEQRVALHSTDAADPLTDFMAKHINSSFFTTISAVEVETETMVRVPAIIKAMGNVFFVELLVEDLPRPRVLVTVLPDEVAEFVRSNGGEAVYSVECNIMTGWYRRYENWKLLGSDLQSRL